MAIQELINSGRIGRPVMIRRTSHGFQRRADWQMLRKYGGGELSNTGPHLIDQVLQLIGEGDLELFADLQHTVGAGDAEDHVKVVLKSQSGSSPTWRSPGAAPLPKNRGLSWVPKVPSRAIPKSCG